MDDPDAQAAQVPGEAQLRPERAGVVQAVDRILPDRHVPALDLSEKMPPPPEAAQVEVEAAPVDRPPHVHDVPLGPPHAEAVHEHQEPGPGLRGRRGRSGLVPMDGHAAPSAARPGGAARRPA